MRRDLFPAKHRNVLGGRNMVPKPWDIQVEVLVVQDLGNPLVHDRLQDGDVEHIPTRGIDVPADCYFQLVVMSVVVGIVADPKRRAIPLVGPLGVVEAVRGIEMYAARYGAGRHRASETWGSWFSISKKAPTRKIGAFWSNGNGEVY
jgi:hypothetical protein